MQGSAPVGTLIAMANISCNIVLHTKKAKQHTNWAIKIQDVLLPTRDTKFLQCTNKI